MSTVQEKVETKEREYTPEEIKQMEAQREAQKQELLKFYNEELPFLRAQAEYEECLTRIDLAKMQRLEMMIARAQMNQGPSEPEKEQPTKPE